MKLSVLLVVLVISCVPSNTSPPPDASDASPMLTDGAPAPDLAVQVCSHLQQIGCPQPATCVMTFRRDQGHVTDFKPACLLSATSPAAATSCGTVACIAMGAVHNDADEDGNPTFVLAKKACANLVAIKCSDGSIADCPRQMTKKEIVGKLRLDDVAAAKTIVQAQRAGAQCQ